MNLAVSLDSSRHLSEENLEQFQWIVMIQRNLEWLFADDPRVFVVGDLFWYPLQGHAMGRQVDSDVMVVCGRLQGERGEYRQWSKEDIFPQVVFEVLSPHQALLEMERKLRFYDRYGAEEYYMYHPRQNELRGWLSCEGSLNEIESMADWISPAIGIRFDLSGPTLQVYGPQGEPFQSYAEILQQAQTSEGKAVKQPRQITVVPRLLSMGLSVEQVAEALELSVEAVEAAAIA